MYKEALSIFTHRIQEELFIGKLSHNVPASDLGKRLVNFAETKTSRFRASIQLATRPLDLIGIDTKEVISNIFYDSTGAPFKEACVLQGYGGESFVFLLKGEVPLVIKMDKQSIGLPIEQQEKRANKLKSNHEQINEWFQDVEDFVTPSEFFIGRLPFRNKHAVGTIQPYIEEFRGVFEDFSDDQLTIFFSQHPSIGRKFVMVVNKIFTVLAESNRAIDPLGEKNLSIAYKNGSPQLVLLDSCDIKDLSIMRKGEDNEDFLQRFDIRMKKLRQLRQSISTSSPAPQSPTTQDPIV